MGTLQLGDLTSQVQEELRKGVVVPCICAKRTLQLRYDDWVKLALGILFKPVFANFNLEGNVATVQWSTKSHVAVCALANSYP